MYSLVIRATGMRRIPSRSWNCHNIFPNFFQSASFLRLSLSPIIVTAYPKKYPSIHLKTHTFVIWESALFYRRLCSETVATAPSQVAFRCGLTGVWRTQPVVNSDHVLRFALYFVCDQTVFGPCRLATVSRYLAFLSHQNAV